MKTTPRQGILPPQVAKRLPVATIDAHDEYSGVTIGDGSLENSSYDSLIFEYARVISTRADGKCLTARQLRSPTDALSKVCGILSSSDLSRNGRTPVDSYWPVRVQARHA